MRDIREIIHSLAPPGLWRRPLARMLLLSLSLHAAVILVVQPRPYPVASELIVLSARLTEARATPPEAEVPPAPAGQAPAILPEPPAASTSPAMAVEPSPAPTAPPAPPVPPARDPEIPPAAGPAAVEAGAVAPRPVEEARAAEPPAAALPSVPVMLDVNWYEARELDTQPRASPPIKPLYPPEAQRRGLEGTVKLMLKVDEYGVVREAEVLESNPPGVFDDSALRAFRAGRFEAARKDRRPVRARIYVRVHYELDD